MENKFNDEFNRIAESEKWLVDYKSIKAGIQNLKEQYEVLNNNKLETGKSNSELNLLIDRIKSMQRKIDQIDRGLASLSNIERKIVTYKCIEGMYYYEFTYKVYKCERQCKRIKRRALEKIAIALGL